MPLLLGTRQSSQAGFPAVESWPHGVRAQRLLRADSLQLCRDVGWDGALPTCSRRPLAGHGHTQPSRPPSEAQATAGCLLTETRVRARGVKSDSGTPPARGNAVCRP